MTVGLYVDPVPNTVADGLIVHEYEDKPDGEAESTTVEPAQTLVLAALAPMFGNAATVTVNGMLTDEQVVVLLLTLKLKSYTPTAIFAGIVIDIGELFRVALVIVLNPGMALTPGESVYLFGLPVEV